MWEGLRRGANASPLVVFLRPQSKRMGIAASDNESFPAAVHAIAEPVPIFIKTLPDNSGWVSWET